MIQYTSSQVRQAARQIDLQTDRPTDRQTDRHRDTEIQKDRLIYILCPHRSQILTMFALGPDSLIQIIAGISNICVTLGESP